MDNFFFPISDTVDFKDNVLIVPSLTIGNVGQLGIDLLIYNNPDFSKVGYICSPHIAPLAGNNALFSPTENNNNNQNQSSLTLGIELFQNKKTQVTILQQRSPAFHSQSKAYAQKFGEWIVKNNFKQVIVLSSTDSAKKGDFLLQLHQPILFQFDTQKCDDLVQEAKKLQLSPVQNQEEIVEIFRTSSVTQYLRKYLLENKISYFILICYCSEGFNSIEALQTATIINHLILKNQTVQWKEPKAWEYLQGKGYEEYDIF